MRLKSKGSFAQTQFRRLKTAVRLLRVFVEDHIPLFLWLAFYRTKAKFRRIALDPMDRRAYHLWIERNEPGSQELEIQKNIHFSYEPKISIIVPVYNPPQVLLRRMIESVLKQTYSNWELCIAEGGSTNLNVKEILRDYSRKDNRIRVKFLNSNKGIGVNSNEALSLAEGDFVAFLDHDDVLSPFALFEIVKTINQNSDVDVIYSDEDKMSDDGKIRFDPFFKPDWSPDLLRSCNYITHFTAIRRQLLDKVGLFREGYDGSQDYDLILRCTENTKKIVHVPKILYHWVAHGGSAASSVSIKSYAYERAMSALRDHLQRLSTRGEVEEVKDARFKGLYRVAYEIEGPPKISVIILAKDHTVVLEDCVNSLLKKSSYKNFEVIIMESRESKLRVSGLYEWVGHFDNVNIISWDKPFNCSAMNNYAADSACGEFLLFLDGATEVKNSEWLERMIEHAQRREVGAVGAKLCDEEGKLEHAGMVVGVRSGAANAFQGIVDSSDFGYFGLPHIIRNCSAVSSACMLMKRDLFKMLGGFDEKLVLGYNDVDLCLRLLDRGYFIVYTPYAVLYHDEETARRRKPLLTDCDYFASKWGEFMRRGDPYYNSNLSLSSRNSLFKLQI